MEEQDQMDEIKQMLRMLDPQARGLVRDGKGFGGVLLLFRSKGIPLEIAKTRARAVVDEETRKAKRERLPEKIFGWIIFVLGASASIYGLLASFDLIPRLPFPVLISSLPLFLGAWLIWWKE